MSSQRGTNGPTGAPAPPGPRSIGRITADADIKYGGKQQEATATNPRRIAAAAATAATKQTEATPNQTTDTNTGNAKQPGGESAKSAKDQGYTASELWKRLFSRDDVKGTPAPRKDTATKPTGQTPKTWDTSASTADESGGVRAASASAVSAAAAAMEDDGGKAAAEAAAKAAGDTGEHDPYPSDDEAGASDTDASVDGLYDAVRDVEHAIGDLAKLVMDVRQGLVVLHRKFDAATGGKPMASPAPAAISPPKQTN